MIAEVKSSNRTGAVLRFVRCQRTGRYFRSGKWTRNCSEANTFGDVLEAVHACARHHLRNVELALRVEGAASDIFRTQIR
jgi:NMD protein affecting ribosome stability and mRNA decay